MLCWLWVCSGDIHPQSRVDPAIEAGLVRGRDLVSRACPSSRRLSLWFPVSGEESLPGKPSQHFFQDTHTCFPVSASDRSRAVPVCVSAAGAYPSLVNVRLLQLARVGLTAVCGHSQDREGVDTWDKLQGQPRPVDATVVFNLSS